MYNYLIDTHCHLDFPQYEGKLTDIINEAVAQGVKYFINPGTAEETIKKAIDIANKFPEVYAAVGYHPHDADSVDQQTIERLKKVIAEQRKIVAIGEVGLDYFKSKIDQKTQQDTFERFIQLAIDTDRPLIIHNREADEDTYAILKNFPAINKKGFVIHCYSSTPDYAQNILELGGYISFTGNITYPKAENIRQTAAIVPINRIMVETDSPFLAPQSKRGMVNKPVYVREVAQTIADVKKMQIEQVIDATTENAIGFFRWEV